MRIGIIGAGQLGQMLGAAARDLDIECEFLDPSDSPPAAAYGRVMQAAFDDRAALAALAERCNVITYEFENVPVRALQNISKAVTVYPPTEALRHAQDRLNEKRLFSSLSIPIPNFATVDTREDLDKAVARIGLPLVLKTRRLGYDGKGQFVIERSTQIEAAWKKLGCNPLLAEQWVTYDYEVSVIGVRGVDGKVSCYPLTRNEHRGGILRRSTAPVSEPELTALAGDYVRRLLERLDYVGVSALELFVVGNKLLANEFAPRVHNSGHWTIEGAETSQFANHLLAITGRPLGSTDCKGHAGMLNLIGTVPDAIRLLGIGALHDYGKSPREGRKLGHVTVVADTAADRDRLVADIEAIVT